MFLTALQRASWQLFIPILSHQKKTVAISKMFNHVQLHVHWMHYLKLGYAGIPAYIYIYIYI